MMAFAASFVIVITLLENVRGAVSAKIYHPTHAP
jgi:hypothetical protein